MFFNSLFNVFFSFKTFKNMSENSEAYFCQKCLNYVKFPHFHAVLGPFKEWIQPTKLLKAIQNDKGHAVGK